MKKPEVNQIKAEKTNKSTGTYQMFRWIQWFACFIVVFLLVIIFFDTCTSPDAVYASTNMNGRLEMEGVISYFGPVVLNQEELEYPRELLEQNDSLYQLVSAEIIEKKVEGTLTYVSAVVPYELEGKQDAPSKTVVTLRDERTGSQFDRELTLLEVKEKAVAWQDTFEFPISVSDYDADIYWLGETAIPKTSELVEYEAELLESLGLAEDSYRINTVEWLGDSYEKDGTIFRDAVAKGEKRIRFVDVKYGDTIRTPDTLGYQYVSQYERIQPEETEADSKFNETIAETAEFQAVSQKTIKDFWEDILDYFQEHLTVITISVVFFAIVLIGIGVIVASWRKGLKNEKLD